MPDPRRREQCTYSAAHLTWLGILMFMTHLGSRRQLRHERKTEAFGHNVKCLCQQTDVDTVADTDTLAYFAEQIPRHAMEGLLASMTTRMIRTKALDAFRLYGYFTVAIDGSQIGTFDREPWPGCPHRKRADGSIEFFAYVLDAKLVTANGMALTLATEMLSNEGHTEFDKQDCELKAFTRLVEKLHGFFPRTPTCLLLDALYANQQTIRLIESRRWKYIISFKEGSMPERFAEARSLMKLQPQNTLSTLWKKAAQTFRWAEGLPIAEFTPNLIECRELAPKKEAATFVWLTNFRVDKNRVQNIANQGGRLRWKIENEGFNVQKNAGYHMEHPFSEHPNGFCVFYILLLIAHYLSQLIHHGSLIESLVRAYGSAKNFARRLAESLRNSRVQADLPIPGQIRFQPP